MLSDVAFMTDSSQLTLRINFVKDYNLFDVYDQSYLAFNFDLTGKVKLLIS